MREEAEEAAAPDASLVTEILGFRTQSVTPDSSSVTVDYRVRNAGAAAFAAYEVYFRVETSSGEAFYEEVAGEDLQPGERDVRSFTEQLRGQTATEVVVEDANVQLATARS